MNTRRLVFAWALAALALGAGPAAPTREAPEPAPPKTELTIFHLKHLAADEARTVLAKLLSLEEGKGPTRIVAEPRTNSLIVLATPEQKLEIEAIIQRLETAAEEAPGGKELVTQVYRLPNLPADKAVLDTLKLILPPDARIAADPRTNAVIVHADVHTHRAVAKLLEEIAAPVPGPADLTVQVRIVWLASGKVPDGAAAPPADFAEVVAKLEKLGVKGPKVLAQFVVPAGPDGKFTIQGRTLAWSLSSRGQLSTRDGRVTLSVQLQATSEGSGRSAPKPLCELETTINYAPGQTVLLGVTPTEELTSVFALQLIAETPRGKGRP